LRPANPTGSGNRSSRKERGKHVGGEGEWRSRKKTYYPLMAENDPYPKRKGVASGGEI